MFLNIPLQADLLAIQQQRQQRIDTNLMKQNAIRWNYDYKVGDLILIKEKDKRKLDAPTDGPYIISQVYTNGTVSVQRTPNVTERINIRRIKPYRGGN